ncbi:von Willebrand factor A domain-containing protein 5B1-like [Diadema antillarum]|uniref:von Willebrand factor A domain-containing protein 5B1-like n=1 Tax=Diadema antillarum TaxID=105358 RepID=UPI003A8AAE1E
MPGLINRHTRAPLTLQAARVSACVNGLSVGLAASLTYFNQEDHVVEGVFAFKMNENTTVAAFEARMLQGRTITVHLKDRTQVEHFNEILTGRVTMTPNQPNILPPGKFALSEFHNARVFCANLGTIRPHGTVTILLSISSLLGTGTRGEAKLHIPSVFTPRYKKHTVRENAPQPQQMPANTTQMSQSSSSASGSASDHMHRSLLDITEEVGENLQEYEFEFQLEIRAPSLLSGVSSSSHAIRVDAEPFASNASNVFVTLAEPHPMDRDLAITIHYPKPHVPVVILEHGDISPTAYEQFVKTENEYKNSGDNDTEDKTRTFLQKRLLKDVMHNPVLMLNYCPDFEKLTQQMLTYRFDVPGEYVLLVDRSGSMSGEYIANARETLMMVLKSLPMNCRFNIIGFGSAYKPLFESSRPYTQDNVSEASAYLRCMRADLGAVANLLVPLQWVYRHPVVRGCPRQIFIFTDGGANNTAEILDLVRSNVPHTRVHAFGVGENASRRLIRGIASAGRGRAEFIATGERMQSKVMTVVRQALQPTISDITAEWILPAGMELLQTPPHHPPISRGEPIVIYALLCDTARLQSTLASVLLRGDSIKRTNPFLDHCLSRGSSSERTEESSAGTNTSSHPNSGSPLKTARQNKDRDPPLPLKLLTPPRKCHSNGLICSCGDTQDPCEVQSHPECNSSLTEAVQQRVQEFTSRRTRAVSMPDNSLAADPTSLQRLLDTLDAADRRQSESQLNGRRRHISGQRHDRSHLNSFDFEPTSPAWDDYIDAEGEELFDADVHMSLSNAVLMDDGELINIANRSGQGCVIVTGLFCGRPIRCEVPFDITTLVAGEWRGPTEEDDAWEETIHQLASGSLLMDYDIQTMGQIMDDEHQPSSDDIFKIRAKMVDLSQASHVICRHTAFVSLDLETLEPLPSPVVIMPSQPRAPHPFQRRAARFWGYNSIMGKQYSSSFTDSEDEAFSSGYGRSESPSSLPSQPVPMPAGTGAQPLDPPGPPLGLPMGPHSPWSSQCSGDYYAWSFEKSYGMSSSSKPRSWQLGSRLNRLRSRLGNAPSKRPLFRAVDVTECCVGRTLSMECVELHALVNLQLASGAWELDYELADAIDIPLEKLRRACLFCDVPVNYEAMMPSVRSPLAGPRFRTLYASSSQGSSLQASDKDSSIDSTRWSPVGPGNETSAALSPPDTASVVSDKSLSQSESGYVTVKSSSPEDLQQAARPTNGSSHTDSNNLAVANHRPDSLASMRAPSPTLGASGRGIPLPKKLETAANFSPSRRRRERFAAVQQLRKEIRHLSPDESQQQRLWATALALVWLEHNCASFFNEWELLAAKADHWLGEQPIPSASGIDLAELKASARQLIVLSRKY